MDPTDKGLCFIDGCTNYMPCRWHITCPQCIAGPISDGRRMYGYIHRPLGEHDDETYCLPPTYPKSCPYGIINCQAKENNMLVSPDCEKTLPMRIEYRQVCNTCEAWNMCARCHMYPVNLDDPLKREKRSCDHCCCTWICRVCNKFYLVVAKQNLNAQAMKDPLVCYGCSREYNICRICNRTGLKRKGIWFSKWATLSRNACIECADWTKTRCAPLLCWWIIRPAVRLCLLRQAKGMGHVMNEENAFVYLVYEDVIPIDAKNAIVRGNGNDVMKSLDYSKLKSTFYLFFRTAGLPPDMFRLILKYICGVKE